MRSFPENDTCHFITATRSAQLLKWSTNTTFSNSDIQYPLNGDVIFRGTVILQYTKYGYMTRVRLSMEYYIMRSWQFIISVSTDCTGLFTFLLCHNLTSNILLNRFLGNFIIILIIHQNNRIILELNVDTDFSKRRMLLSNKLQISH